LKRETKLRKLLNKTSFKSQLFLIILVSFIVFELSAYLIITYTLNNKYTKRELEDQITLIKDLIVDINKKDKKLVTSLYDFQLISDSTVLVLNNSTGGYLVEDYESYNYLVEDMNNIQYIIPSFDVELKEGKTYSFYLKKDSIDELKIVRKIKDGDEVLFQDNYINLSDPINITIKRVEVPSNLNYLYITGGNVTESLNVLENKYNDFIKVDATGGEIKYLLDKNAGYIYFIVKPNEIDSVGKQNDVLYIVSPFAETETLFNTTSVSFIFIVIISLLIAVLIAVFISSAFSNPIKIFEKEMLKLKENNYKETEYGFKNKEMISLENTLNEVKVSISAGVESIKNQSKKLEKLNKELVNEEELRASFVQRLSHELKTPLMIISATTEALESGLIEKENEKGSYETILNEVDKTTVIIKEIINNYKNISDKNSLKKTEFNLNELVLEVLKPLIPLAENSELKVITNLDRVCYIKANKEMIKNVISNYITNAIKYTPKGNNINININEDETSFTFEVINHGVHISENNLEKIWLPFFREKEDVDSVSTGMGLYIVKTALESHKFDYDVTNYKDGVRSYFIIKK